GGARRADRFDPHRLFAIRDAEGQNARRLRVGRDGEIEAARLGRGDAASSENDQDTQNARVEREGRHAWSPPRSVFCKAPPQYSQNAQPPCYPPRRRPRLVGRTGCRAVGTLPPRTPLLYSSRERRRLELISRTRALPQLPGVARATALGPAGPGNTGRARPAARVPPARAFDLGETRRSHQRSLRWRPCPQARIRLRRRAA